MVETPGEHDMEVVDLRFESLRDLQEEFGPFLSNEGFFLQGRSDFAASDVLRFRLMLPGEFVLVEGAGVVVWTRSPGEATPDAPFGAAVGFATLSDQGRELVERIVDSHVERGGKPFDMSRPAGNGAPEEFQSQAEDAKETTGEKDKVRFTVRGAPDPEPEERAVAEEVEQRLPFSEDSSAPDDEVSAPQVEAPEEEIGVSDGDGEVSGLKEAPVVADTPEAMEISAVSEQSPFAVEVADSGLDEAEPVMPAPSDQLDISLPDEQFLDGDLQTASWEDEEPESSDLAEKKGRSGLLRIAVGLIVLTAGAWAVWMQFPEYVPWGRNVPDMVAAVNDESADEELVSESLAPLTGEDLEAAVEAAVDAVTASNQVDESEPTVEPTTVPVPVEVVGAPGHTIVDIRAERGEDGTLVLIRSDGLIEKNRIRTSVLTNPPRILVRISGITSLYRPLEIQVGTPEIQSIRIGHHPETHPPSLWIVLDRVDEGVNIQDVEVSGNAVQVRAGR